jgi:hypothetical protein
MAIPEQWRAHSRPDVVVFPEVVHIRAPGVAHEVGGVPVPQHILHKVVGGARLLFVTGHHHGVCLTLSKGRISQHTPKCLIFVYVDPDPKPWYFYGIFNVILV